MSVLTDYAWAAGFIDGEGYIAVARKNPSYGIRKSGPNIGRPRRDGVVYWMVMAATQRNPEPLYKLKDLFGGVVSYKPRKKQNDYYQWRIGQNDALAALEAMLPFFVGKREVATLAVSFQRWYGSTIRENGRAMTDERRNQAQFYHIECRRLIRRFNSSPTEGAQQNSPASAEVLRLATGSEG